MAAHIWKRQGPLDATNGSGQNGGHDNCNYAYCNGDTNFWYSATGMAIRYAVIGFLFIIVVGFFAGGYYHAQRRISQGKEPLAYHRWMTNRRHYNYSFQPRDGYRNERAYGMENYPPGPPAYHATEVPPPVYQPPAGATKAMADQNLPPPPRFEGSGGGPVAPGVVASR